MEITTSIDNLKIKHIIKLKDKKYRDEYRQYITEGARWVLDALKSGNMSDIVELVVLKNSVSRLYSEEILTAGIPFIIADDKIFDKISLEENNQGILAVLKQRIPPLRPQNDYCIFLDRIRDPGNMGTILRTCAAAGFTDIICSGCVDVYNPKVIRSCMSAIMNVNIFFSDEEIIPKMQKEGYKIISGDLGGENIFKTKIEKTKVCLVIGNEAEGIKKEIISLSDFTIKIPVSGVESLNASVAAGILMYMLKFVN